MEDCRELIIGVEEDIDLEVNGPELEAGACCFEESATAEGEEGSLCIVRFFILFMVSWCKMAVIPVNQMKVANAYSMVVSLTTFTSVSSTTT